MLYIYKEPKTPEEQKLLDRYLHYEGEKIWRKKVLDSIEPNMTQDRMNELKISIQVKLLDEVYQITMDGIPIGETYPMPPGMLDAIIWGKPTKIQGDAEL